LIKRIDNADSHLLSIVWKFIRRYDKKRLRHFINRVSERTGIILTVDECLNIESKINSTGVYLGNVGDGRECRLISTNKRVKLVVIYNRDNCSLVTAFPPWWNTHKSKKKFLTKEEINEHLRS